MPTPDRLFPRFLAFLLLLAAVVIAVVIVAWRNAARSVETGEWVNHTHAARAAAADLLSSLHAAEAALRTYLLTGDPRDQAAYRAAFSDLAENMDVAKALTRAVPEQHGQILRLEELLARRADLARESIRIRQEGTPEQLQALLAADTGGDAVREIGRAVGRFRQEQAELLAARDRASFLQAQTTRWTVLAGLVLDLLLLAGAAWLVRDDLRARQRAADALRLANEQLETKVRERTAELTAANAALRMQNLEGRWSNQALQHQLHYNQLIINSVSELAIVVTRNLNISRVNSAVERLAGREAAGLVDRPLGDFLRLTGAELMPVLTRALKDGHDLRDRAASLTDKSGRVHALDLSLFPLRDGNKIVGGVVTLRTPATST
jgi:PAS domain S-box-containing protein